MIFENSIKTNKDAFIAELQRYCNLLGFDPEWLMTVMYAESRVNEKARNPKTKATGLIQFMPSTAKGLNTTVDALYNLTNVQQLYFVYLYFKPFAGRVHSVYDLYKCVFFPAMLGKADDWVAQTSSLSAETVAKYNPIIDMNHNHQITVSEFCAYVDTYLKKKLQK